MPSRLILCTTIPALFTLALVLGGCASAPTQSKAGPDQAVFFPESPAQPRLQFLMSFSDGKYKESAGKSSFSDWIVGSTKEQQASSRFNSPYGVAVRNGRAYICDVGSHVVHVVDFVAQSYGRLESPTKIVNPVNITIDADGTKYLCDSGKNKVLVFDAQDRFVREFGDPKEWTPLDVAIKGDRLYIVDVTGAKIHVWSKQGQRITSFATKGDGPDQLRTPTNLEFGPDGRLYVTDTGQQTIKIFSDEGAFLGAIGGPGSIAGQFARPKGIAIDSAGVVYVADAQWDVVQLFRSDGRILMVFGKPGAEPYAMGMPAGLAIDRTSLEHFRRYIDPQFKAEYLLFVVNQFGANKIAVYAYGTMPNWTAPAAEAETAAPTTQPAE